jgi:hypothetical protein
MHLKLKKGALHKALGVSAGHGISLAKLRKAKASKNPLMRKRATFAMNARKWKH